MSSVLKRRLLVMLLALPCLGAGPSKPGTDVRVGGGVGRYSTSTGCGGPNINVRDVSAYGRVSHQLKGGARGTIEVGHSEGRITSVQNAPGVTDPISVRFLGYAPARRTYMALRLGGAWKYGGFELGAVWSASQNGWSSGGVLAEPYPSTEAWLGVPRYAYVWGRFLSGPNVIGSGRAPLTGVGLGHHGEGFRFELGYNWSGLVIDGDVRVWRRLRLGMSSNWSDTRTWATLMTMGYRFGGPEED